MTILVGREVELAWMHTHLEPGETTRGRIVLVTGEGGIGKTHLVSEAVPEHMRLGWITFPRARFAAPGFGLRELARLAGGAAGALEDQLAESSGDAGPWKFVAIAEAADRILARRPERILVLDDLQWADELTLGWLANIGGLLARAPVRIVALVRSVEALPPVIAHALGPLARSDAVSRLWLGPLAVDAVAALAQSLGLEDAVRLAGEIHARTDGVPLAVKELVPALSRHAEGLGLAEGGSHPMPPLRALIAEQLRELPEAAGRLVAVAALLPSPATERLVRTVTGLSPSYFDEALEAALEVQLVVRDQRGALSFRHELHREAVQALVPLATRRELCRAIAMVLSREPGHPAGEVASLLLEAGLADEAGEWFERAADEARRVHDHGSEFTHLRHAIELAATSDLERVTSLGERLGLAARNSTQLSAGIETLDPVLSLVGEGSHRGRLLLCLDGLMAFSGAYQGRIEMLERARETFASVGDRAGVARALAEMSLPLGTEASVKERVAFGRQALQEAETADDAPTLALAASNLAAAELLAGSPSAFELFALAARTLEKIGPSVAEETVRNLGNWATSAVSFGDYTEAQAVLRAGLRLSRNPVHRTMLHAVDALRLWRIGRWDDALTAARGAREDISFPEILPFVNAIEASIAFEREPRPDPSPVARATEALVEASDENWASVTQAMLMRIRSARREPHPERGLTRVLELVKSTGSLVGWDDLLPSSAEVGAAVCGRMLNVLGNLRPVGPRAEAAIQYMSGTLPGVLEEREESLIEAAERYLHLPEPYAAARALEATAALRVSARRHAGDPRARAAEIYRDLGADRSLATLIRRSSGSRALEGFRIPLSQSRAGAPGLTPRERDVAELARRGNTATEIGQLLSIATGTATKHLERVKRKLGVQRKRDLVRILSEE